MLETMRKQGRPVDARMQRMADWMDGMEQTSADEARAPARPPPPHQGAGQSSRRPRPALARREAAPAPPWQPGEARAPGACARESCGRRRRGHRSRRRRAATYPNPTL